MPRGVAQTLTSNPQYTSCLWCGVRFQKKADNHLYCRMWHQKLASYQRQNLKVIPSAAVPQVKRNLPPSTPSGV